MSINRLAEGRKKLGYTQLQMAYAFGMSLKRYGDLETGKAQVRKIHLLALEAILVDKTMEERKPSRVIALVTTHLEEILKFLSDIGQRPTVDPGRIEEDKRTFHEITHLPLPPPQQPPAWWL